MPPYAFWAHTEPRPLRAGKQSEGRGQNTNAIQQGTENMDIFGRYCGWRQLWLVCLGLFVWLAVQAILTILPSRAEVAGAYLRKALEIEKRFDFSLWNMSSPQLASRYAGLSGDEAVARIRDKLHRAYSDSLTRAGLFALNERNMESFTVPRAGGDLLRVNYRPQLTPEALASMKSELEQLTQRYESRLAALPAQKRKAVAFGVLLVSVPMALVYLLSALLARPGALPRAAANAASGEEAPAAHRIPAEPTPRPAPADGPRAVLQGRRTEILFSRLTREYLPLRNT